jgi:hypothetical protein
VAGVCAVARGSALVAGEDIAGAGLAAGDAFAVAIVEPDEAVVRSGVTLGAAVIGATDGATVGADVGALVGAADRVSVGVDGDGAGLLDAALVLGAVVDEVETDDRTSVVVAVVMGVGDGLALVAALRGTRLVAGDALALGWVLWPAFAVDVGVAVGDPLGIGDATALPLGAAHGRGVPVAGGGETGGSATTAATPRNWYPMIAKMRRATTRRPPVVSRVRYAGRLDTAPEVDPSAGRPPVSTGFARRMTRLPTDR